MKNITEKNPKMKSIIRDSTLYEPSELWPQKRGGFDWNFYTLTNKYANLGVLISPKINVEIFLTSVFSGLLTMEVLKWLIFYIFCINYGILGYKIQCEEGWLGFSESTSCYFFAHEHPESFKDAKEICERFDAHLLIIDSKPEKVFFLYRRCSN